MSAVTIDTLTWHLAIVGSATGMAYAVFVALPSGHGFPLFAFALLTGDSCSASFSRGRGWRRSSTSPTIRRIGGTATDYLVGFGVASIAVTVVLEYAVPLGMLMLLGMAITLGQLRFLGPRMFRSFWFERSLFAFGWNTGVVATGITLVRVVDPEDKSRTLEDFGLAYPPVSFIEIAIVTAAAALRRPRHRDRSDAGAGGDRRARRSCCRACCSGGRMFRPPSLRPSEIADQRELTST